MALLLRDDYRKLADKGISYVEDEARRFLVFAPTGLPGRLYTLSDCEVLVKVPGNYNQAGNDMFWTYPQLVRADGKPIPAASPPGGESESFGGKVYCRWSRHWTSGSAVWRAGRDDVISIYRRVMWALEHPDTK